MNGILNTLSKSLEQTRMVNSSTFHFRDYLFKCKDSSEVTLISVYGEHHIAVPLHDLSRQTLSIFDISIGQHKKLPPQEQKDLQKMLKMAQAACSEILQRSLEETQPTQVLGIVHRCEIGFWGEIRNLSKTILKVSFLQVWKD